PPGEPGGGGARRSDPVQDVYGKREFGRGWSLGLAQGRSSGLADGGGGTECREDGAQGGRGSRGYVQRHGGSPLISTGTVARGRGRTALSAYEVGGATSWTLQTRCRLPHALRQQDPGPR